MLQSVAQFHRSEISGFIQKKKKITHYLSYTLMIGNIYQQSDGETIWKVILAVLFFSPLCYLTWQCFPLCHLMC